MADPQPHKLTAITATDVQRHSGALLRRAARDGARFLVERDGYPVAVILPKADYDRLLADARGARRRPAR